MRGRLLSMNLLALLAAANAWSAGPFFNIADYGAARDGAAPRPITGKRPNRRPRRSRRRARAGREAYAINRKYVL